MKQLTKFLLITSSATWFPYLILGVALSFFLLLSWKNPYTNTSLIGNFDPFPDTLNYVVPARNFVMGEGFRFTRPEGELRISVPPLYSFSLIPAYILNLDARTYYFVNLLLGGISIYVLFKISKTLTGSSLLTGLILLLYTGTYVIYWQTALAMAENMLLPMLFFAMWFYLQPLSKTSVIMTTLLALGCFGAKYVALPLTLALLSFLVFKIWIEKTQVLKTKANLTILIIGITMVGFILLNGSEVGVRLHSFLHPEVMGSDTIQTTPSWFDLAHFPSSFPSYAKALFGLPIYNLWTVKPILPLGLAGIVLLWCAYAIWRLPEKRVLALTVLGLTLSQLVFLSLIVMIEGRYAFVFLPLIYTGLAALLGWSRSLLLKKQGPQKSIWCEVSFVLISATILLVSSYPEMKTQLLNNFKGSEVPWWHVGIVAADNSLLSFQHQQTTSPLMISSLSPFLWDFYRQGQYQVMPLAKTQSHFLERIWGIDFNQVDLYSYYADELKKGRKVYLSTVGFGATDWQILDTQFKQAFGLQLLSEECNQACKLFQVTQLQPH